MLGIKVEVPLGSKSLFGLILVIHKIAVPPKGSNSWIAQKIASPRSNINIKVSLILFSNFSIFYCFLEPILGQELFSFLYLRFVHIAKGGSHPCWVGSICLFLNQVTSLCFGCPPYVTAYASAYASPNSPCFTS